MAASYPSSAKTFTTKNNSDTIQAAHVNDLQDEVTAVEQGLLNGVAHDLLPSTNNTRDLGATATRFRDLFLSRNADITGTLAVGGIVTAAAQPRCRVTNSAVQSIPDDTTTVLTWDTETFDVGAMHDTGSQTDRITVPTGGTGVYLVIAGANFAADADGYRHIQITKNGTVVASAQAPPNGAVVTALQASALVAASATDIFRAGVHHTAGAALNVGGDAGTATFFAAIKIW